MFIKRGIKLIVNFVITLVLVSERDQRYCTVPNPLFREGTFFLGGGGLGNFDIFSQKSVGPPLRFNKRTPDPPPPPTFR